MKEKKFEFGDRLKELRKPSKNGEKKITMEELCEIFSKEYGLTVNKAMISRWENGSVVPDNKHLIAYANYFNIDLNYLLGLSNIKRKITDFHIDSNPKKDRRFAELFSILGDMEDEKFKVIEDIVKKLCNLDMEVLEAYNKILKR
ncbi:MULTISPECIES: helix-turn-helix domain-containing protein [Fusobacterium]|uniref:helix-turn-helix domain-containing protein n=1 Tax=Fusobacterium TaxID=848 RepID=UPI0014776A7C|nr:MULTISPECIES: helix-turn-helix transcriptional regulator [Fusobacterium]NME35793.1 helix-turn-helix transcriptional regulator [Fusobacterium sp. FSA-380-WT-3A]